MQTFRSHAWCLVASLALALLFAPHPSVAGDDVMYRADDRRHEIIFREGFRGRGSNLDLLQHLAGTSCWLAPGGVPRSAYVSMADVPDVAMVYADNIYRIRPDADAPDATAAFSTLSGMRAIQRDAERLGLNLPQRAAVDQLVDASFVEGQYVSQRIPPEWIQSVRIFGRINGNRVFLREVQNPRYRQPARIGARETFSQPMIDGIRGGAALPSWVRYAVAPNGTASAACMDSGSDACGTDTPRPMSARATNNPNGLRCTQTSMLLPGNVYQRTVDAILSP